MLTANSGNVYELKTFLLSIYFLPKPSETGWEEV
jgi:hypothetical protein